MLNVVFTICLFASALGVIPILVRLSWRLTYSHLIDIFGDDYRWYWR